MATAQELITIMREDHLSDVYNGLDTATQEQKDASVLWTDAQLLRYLTEAQDQACIRAELIEDDTTTEFCRISLSSARTTYNINNRILRINRVVDADGNELTHLSKYELNHKYPDWRDEPNVKAYFMRNYKMHLLYTPTTGTYLYLEVNRLPENETMELEEEFEIPLGMHKDLIWHALHLAYSKQDAETYDPQRAGYFAGRFARAFGPEVDNRVLIHQLEEPQRNGYIGPSLYFKTSADASDDDGW